ncbi:ABC transporter permease [Orrella sp. NBD-18]|uniref:Transport permease protein n=2 Tax=Sheuella amnicola TaxID=2707330 RepID=A0A6B2QXW1_9BURK|nr:ABC transporter permease [Sheuella amnicola]
MSSAYTGSVFGNAWLIIDPLISVLVTLVFFQFTMKNTTTSDIPFVAWVLPQIILWTFISATMNSSVNMIREYGYLNRHKSFDMRLLGLIKIYASTYIHIFLILGVIIVLYLVFDLNIKYNIFGVIYYFICVSTLLLGISWIVSTLGVFWKDTRHIVSIFLQLDFWISPIFWEPERFPKAIAFVMYANPFYYPIHGYRASILGEPFGPHFFISTLYFWSLVIIFMSIGSLLFKRLSPSFGDVI